MRLNQCSLYLQVLSDSRSLKDPLLGSAVIHLSSLDLLAKVCVRVCMRVPSTSVAICNVCLLSGFSQSVSQSVETLE